MRVRFMALLALFLAGAPIASAQLVVAPQVGHYDLNGAWEVQGVFLGTLTLATNANGILRGSYASPVLQNNSTCRGEYRGAGFLMTCQQAGKPHIVFSGATLPRTFTRADPPPNTIPPPQMRGYQYVVSLSDRQATEPMTQVSFTARRD